MERILIDQIQENDGKKVLIKGRVLNMRNLGNIVFLIIQDYTGAIQVVFDKNTEAKTGDAVAIEGTAKKEIRSKYDLNLNLSTLLDYRTLSLRHPKVQAIFKIYDILLKGYEITMREEKFTEIKTPKILGAATEGGANFFKVKYFDKEAALAQSPQFYKQIMVGVFERVFEIGPAFRAEPHFTTRHVNEYISLDAEMGYIKDFYDVIEMLNKILKKMFLMI